GDLAKWLPDGNIVFLGRKDHQVKVRGFRIELEEIRKQLLQHKDIKEAVILVRQDSENDKYLCAYVVAGRLAAGDVLDMLDIAALRGYLSERLPEYMIPTRFVPLESLPLNPNGKVDRKALPEPGTGSDRRYAAPRDDLEKKLQETWSELLGIEKDKVGINDNFFEIGGHSLKATILISRIHKAFNVKIPLAAIFRGPSIKEMAVKIREAGGPHFYAIPLAEKKEYYPLTAAMKQLYFEQQLDSRGIAYNVFNVAVLEGKLERVRLAETFRKL
ncbi:MAG: hypothetical protein GY940_22330, partial [bacterium]|nr:hypothetical protein [bacterium]